MIDFFKQKTIKSEKDGEEKVKKPRFPIILVPPRRLSRVDSTSGEHETAIKPLRCIISTDYTCWLPLVH